MMLTGDVGEIDTRGVGWSGGRAPVTECYDLAVVCREQARTRPVTGAWCESIATVEVGCPVEDALLKQERAG